MTAKATRKNKSSSVRSVQPFRLSRRSLLRSASALGAGTIWLPPLEAMFNATGTAHADGTAKAKRFVEFIWGVSYTTSDGGRTWAPRSGSGPLPTNLRYEFVTDDKYQAKIKSLIGKPEFGITADHLMPSLSDPDIRKYIRIIDGISIAANVTQSNEHYQAAHAVWTLDKNWQKFNQSNSEWALGPSLDRYVGSFAHYRGGTAPHMYLGCLPIANYGGVQFMGLTQRLSIDYVGMRDGRFSGNEAKTREQAAYDPMEVFDQVFGASGKSNDDPEVKRTKSILDGVQKVSQSTLDRMSAADRQAVEVHLESIRQLEKNLVGTGGCGNTMQRPETARMDLYGQLRFIERQSNTIAPRVAKDMRDLAAMMIKCDYTRNLIYMVSAPIGGANMEYFLDMDNLGSRPVPSLHRDSHDARAYHRVTTPFHMGQLAGLIKALASIPEGAGNALDDTFIWAASENGPQVHSMENVATIMAGSPTLIGGNYYDNVGRRTIADLHLGILNALGLDDKGYRDWVKPPNPQPVAFK